MSTWVISDFGRKDAHYRTIVVPAEGGTQSYDAASMFWRANETVLPGTDPTSRHAFGNKRKTYQKDLPEGFNRRHGVRILAQYEAHDRMEGAMVREKGIKGWILVWKSRLIETANPQSLGLCGELR